MRHKVIRILWNKPLTVPDAILSTELPDVGLYYITRIFRGKEESLYLGKSISSIKRRLSSHLPWLDLYQGRIQVRIGQVVYPRNASPDVIDHAESALIFHHGSLFWENTCTINSYSYSDLYTVVNVGDLYELYPIIKMHDQ